MSGKASRDYSRELQEKLEIYLVGLTFTLLATAVQTVKAGGSAVADAAELASWLLLFASGLAGLSRLEWLPVAHLVHGATQDVEVQVEQLEQLGERGHLEVTDDEEVVLMADALARRKAKLAGLEAKETAFTRSTRRKYLVHKWTFLTGLALLLVARGYMPAQGVIAAAMAPSTASGTPAARNAPISAPAAVRSSSH